MDCKLSNKKCVPCNKNIPPLKGAELEAFHKLLDDWQVVEKHHLQKEYLFSDFSEALTFTNKIGEIAEQEGHHPDILLSYGKVIVQLWTHKIDGLSESDFVLAAKCDEVSKSMGHEK
jgi:4a-hydroxytetrahydrobiopterin dehydratase